MGGLLLICSVGIRSTSIANKDEVSPYFFAHEDIFRLLDTYDNDIRSSLDYLSCKTVFSLAVDSELPIVPFVCSQLACVKEGVCRIN